MRVLDVEDTDVRIDAGRLAVIVARRQVDVAADAVLLLPHDQGDFAVGF